MRDWHDAFALLNVVKEAQGHQKLWPLRDAAMAELEKIAETIKGEKASPPLLKVEEPKEAPEPVARRKVEETDDAA